MSLIASTLLSSPYKSYTYAYPHKTAYRPFSPRRLSEVWQQQNRRALFLYLHIPFCEMRCDFCNLFTTVNTSATLVTDYLDALERQVQQTKYDLGESNIVQMAIGGGTPTYLKPAELQRLYQIIDLFNVDYVTVPTSVEVSPATATRDRLSILAEYHTQRVSIGIQSFVESEVKSVGRPQRNAKVFQALDAIRHSSIPVLNIDLIYGLAHQTPQSWLFSLQTALTFAPEELFLYPLYVRPLTGIGLSGKSWDDERFELYQLGRDYLLAHGYQQVSMRMFRRCHTLAGQGEYCCQNDGMLGLGCGARSYTEQLHYSSEYAVGQEGVRSILQHYIRRERADFAYVNYGFQLDLDNQRRRFIIQGLLRSAGLSLSLYRQRFASDVLQDYPQLLALFPAGLAQQRDSSITLTSLGLAYSDAIGPWLYADEVVHQMDSYELT
ncbi:STM4012 family radical SAM protein [Serratia microhaemolytica]|uniref:STM4012 family radical SAM protein n=1 Tax=Serratia microhaemolytica TaxID=2675110 RepID=UPI000FDE015E|nr:STM4012 family radical SAM protein [Serratia microhaemolytica]